MFITKRQGGKQTYGRQSDKERGYIEITKVTNIWCFFSSWDRSLKNICFIAIARAPFWMAGSHWSDMFRAGPEHVYLSVSLPLSKLTKMKWWEQGPFQGTKNLLEYQGSWESIYPLFWFLGSLLTLRESFLCVPLMCFLTSYKVCYLLSAGSDIFHAFNSFAGIEKKSSQDT